MSDKDKKGILKDAYQKIKDLMAEEKWREAHRACLELLRFDPDNIKVIRFKNNIEKNVKKINIKAIKDDLETLKPLWEQKKYEEIIEHLRELKPYINEYPPLKNIIIKAQTEYNKQIKIQQKDYLGKEIQEVDKLMSAHKYREALIAAEQLKKLDINEKDILEVITRVKKTWIDHELSINETLLKSDKHEDINLLIQKLLKIDSKSAQLIQLNKSNKKKGEQNRIEKKRDFIFIGLEKTKTLLQLKKYAKALQAAKEILAIDSKNSLAKSYFRKASKKESKQISKEVVKQMKQAQKNIKKDYKKDKKKFLHI